MQARTTDLAQSKAGVPFTWGEVIRFYQVGEYDIVEYHPWNYTDYGRDTIDYNRVKFHGWLDGRDVSRSWESLDAALAGLIALKHEGPNSQAGFYFMRMVTKG